MLTIASFHRHVAPRSTRVASQLSSPVDDSVKEDGSRTDLRPADVDCAAALRWFPSHHLPVARGARLLRAGLSGLRDPIATTPPPPAPSLRRPGHIDLEPPGR